MNKILIPIALFASITVLNADTNDQESTLISNPETITEVIQDGDFSQNIPSIPKEILFSYKLGASIGNDFALNHPFLYSMSSEEIEALLNGFITQVTNPSESNLPNQDEIKDFEDYVSKHNKQGIEKRNKYFKETEDLIFTALKEDKSFTETPTGIFYKKQESELENKSPLTDTVTYMIKVSDLLNETTIYESHEIETAPITNLPPFLVPIIQSSSTGDKYEMIVPSILTGDIPVHILFNINETQKSEDVNN